MESEQTYSEYEVTEALIILGFEETDQLPKLKAVRKTFFNIAKFNHPDKNAAEEEKTKEEREEFLKKVLNAYNLVVKAIFENEKRYMEEDDVEEDEDEDTEDQGDDEICFTEEKFKEVNLVKTNQRSLTIKIPTKHADA